MEEFVPGQVYINLVKMMGYRGAELTNPQLSPDAVIQRLNHFEYVMIHGRRQSDDIRGAALVVIILIAPGSKYSNKSGDFKKLLKELPKLDPKMDNEYLEVVFVSDEPLTIHIEKHMVSYRNENPRISLESHDYSIFMIETPKHESVPEHKLISEKETLEICDKYLLTKTQFPKINMNEPQAIWLGLRPGMVVRIERPSETAGKSIAYRICTK